MTDPHMMDRGEVEALLPWYVAGSLDEADMERVKAFLATTSEFDAQIASIREDLGETIEANEIIRGPAPGALDRLMRDLEKESAGSSSVRSTAVGLIGGIEQFLKSLSPGRLGFAAMTAALVIAVQAGLLGSTFMHRGATFETAGGEVAATTGTVFLVQFKTEADIGAIATFLAANNARIVSGPENGVFFKISVGESKLGTAERDALQRRIETEKNLVEVIIPSQ